MRSAIHIVREVFAILLLLISERDIEGVTAGLTPSLRSSKNAALRVSKSTSVMSL